MSVTLVPGTRSGDSSALPSSQAGVGLQFIDAYLGLWRLMRTDLKPHFAIKPSELKAPDLQHWSGLDDFAHRVSRVARSANFCPADPLSFIRAVVQACNWNYCVAPMAQAGSRKAQES